MSSDRDVNRIVRSWLEDGATSLPDRVLDNVLAELPTTSQRRSSSPVRRIADMNIGLRLALAAAVLVLAAVVGLQFLPGDNDVGGPRPSPTAPPLPADRGILSAGTYSLEPGFPVSVTLAIPDGWAVCTFSAVEQGLCLDASPPEGSLIGVSFLDVVNVVVDPCGTALRSPPVGPSVDDLIAAISDLEGFTLSEPVDISVDGYAGKSFTVTAPHQVPVGCDLKVWATNQRINGVGADETNEVRIVDVDGERIFLSIAHFPFQPEAKREAARQVLNTIQIQP